MVDGWEAFGQTAKGDFRARVEASPQWQDGHFENPQPLVNDTWGMVKGAWRMSADTTPKTEVPFEPVPKERFDTPPASGLRVTWLGHATTLVEVDGQRVLFDPVWSERASPLSWLGPRRWYRPPLALDDVPRLDAVVISHDHYDHLDLPTVRALNARGVTFFVPLGVGAHLRSWGVDAARVVELDWWESKQVGSLEVVCTPSRHASGRFLFDFGQQLWSGWALKGPTHRVYYSGDTGLFPGMKDIGERLGPFDVTLIEVGQYHSAWPDWHIGPEQAVTAHQWVQGKLLLPVHWGLFTLAYHAWTEPAERVLAEAQRQGVSLVIPRPGQSVEPSAPPAVDRWWPPVAFQTAEEMPIHSTGMP
ncbi:MAG: MBL fold metallo-hydrolase [Myxococcota bacterium]